MSLGSRDITVIGAGIAGLAVGQALARTGARVRVMEQAPRIGEVGAGLQISPNGLRVIDALGLGAKLRAVSVKAEAIRLRDFRGRDVTRLDLARHAPDDDYLFVHRARLIEVLEAGARDAGVEIATGQRIEAPGPGEVALLVGADGVKSWVRAAINGPAEPFFTGQVAWRAVVPEDSDAFPEAQVFMGPGRHLVSYPLHGGLRNIVAVEERKAWAEEGWNHEDDPANLRRAFEGFAPEVQGWLARVEQVHIWGLFRHPVAKLWHDGPRAILGDAAHPTLPFLAQGANMALEDAWALAACLANAPQDEALARYQSLRRKRVEGVIAVANANARLYHVSAAPLRWAVHTGMSAAGRLSPRGMLARFDWLYGYDVTNGAAERYR